MTTPGYNTVNQEVHWGAGDAYVDLGRIISGLENSTELATVQRVLLSSDYPTADVAQVRYRFSAPRMRVGDGSELVRTNPMQPMALVRTDDMQAMLVSSAVVAGVPHQAAANGEITSNVTFSPFGIVYRGTATQLDGSTTTVTVESEKLAYAVITDGTGQVSGAGANLTVTGKGVMFAALTTGTAITVASALRGWLIHDLEQA